MRDASGTASVSTAVPSPTDPPGRGIPGIYRGATTRGKRNVTSPSAYGRTPHKVSSTVARSPGMRLPTRRLKTPGRSSSAIAARRPCAIACVVVLACLPSLLEDPVDLASRDHHPELRHRGAIGQREDVRRFQRLVERVDERLAHHDPRQQSVDASADLHRLQWQMTLLRPQRTEARLVVGHAKGRRSGRARRPGSSAAIGSWVSPPSRGSMRWERIKVRISGAAADRMASTSSSSSGRDGTKRSVTPSRSGTPKKVRGTSAVACRTTLAGLASPGRSPRPMPDEPPVPASRSRQPLATASPGRPKSPGRDVQPADPAQLRVGLSGQGLLDLGQALALGLKLLDGHDLEQMPTAIQCRTPAHLRRPVDQPQRRVVADRPTVGHVPHPATRGAVVALRQRRRDGIR